MLYMKCPNCGETLGNKQLIYETEIVKICSDLKLDYNLVSKGLGDIGKEYKKRRADLINKISKKICCKHSLITYIDCGDIVK